MAEYIEREAVIKRLWTVSMGDDPYIMGFQRGVDHAIDVVNEAVAADVAPVVHGRWIETEEHPDDAYCHHKCSNCNEFAPFDYKYREDWDEGMDGEWYSLGIIDDGINEHLTAYCPNCGARMDGE